MKKLLLCVPAMLTAVSIWGQHIATGMVQQNATVQATLVNTATGKPIKNEQVIFQSIKNKKQFKTLTGTDGKFTTKLPAGDAYYILIPGFRDTVNTNLLEIPALADGDFYKDPFIVQVNIDPVKISVLENVEFDFRRAALNVESYPALDALAGYLTRKNNLRIEIRGFTDNVGNQKANLKLSLQRASSVAQYLQKKGVSSQRMEVKGFGALFPLEDNNLPEGRKRNRRIEIKFLAEE